jgi:hypothetical protein
MPPITQWHPEAIFALSCAIGALGGFGRLLGKTDTPLTARNVGEAIIVHGCIGGGFAGVGYEYLGWKGRPLALLGFAALYGGGVVTAKFITGVIEGLLPNRKPGGPDAT